MVDGVVVGSACAKVDNTKNSSGSIVLILISFDKKFKVQRYEKKMRKVAVLGFFAIEIIKNESKWIFVCRKYCEYQLFYLNLPDFISHLLNYEQWELMLMC